jgi:hypothetical protein
MIKNQINFIILDFWYFYDFVMIVIINFMIDYYLLFVINDVW